MSWRKIRRSFGGTQDALSFDLLRLMGCNQLAQQWAASGALRVSAEEAANQLWLTSSFETYQLSLVNLGWDSARYESWLYETAERLLFD